MRGLGRIHAEAEVTDISKLTRKKRDSIKGAAAAFLRYKLIHDVHSQLLAWDAQFPYWKPVMFTSSRDSPSSLDICMIMSRSQTQARRQLAGIPQPVHGPVPNLTYVLTAKYGLLTRQLFWTLSGRRVGSQFRSQH
jgi:hypothetical protein